MKRLLPKYFSSEWSYAQFRVPDVRTLVAFGSDKNSIIGASFMRGRALVADDSTAVVSADGQYFKATWEDGKPGSEMKLVQVGLAVIRRMRGAMAHAGRRARVCAERDVPEAR
jgi:hypothetical protein